MVSYRKVYGSHNSPNGDEGWHIEKQVGGDGPIEIIEDEWYCEQESHFKRLT